VNDDGSSVGCIKDCSGDWGGELIEDECGICGGPGATDECGCDDILEGACDCDGNVLDECGICNGNNSNCLDCAGVPNGLAYEDECGVCDSDSSNDCILDCSGVWGGDSTFDICGLCGGPGISGGLDCNGECCTSDNKSDSCNEYGSIVYELDCLNTCGGTVMPIFECSDGNFVCSPSQCFLNIQTNIFPDIIGISRVFPNPFNPVVEINYKVPHLSLVSIRIYNIQGKEIVHLINDYSSPGQYHVAWDASFYSSGLYFIEMVVKSNEFNQFRDVRKVLYLK
tara:strand:- start:79 stop:924 length:846 start_codon:yes stop_codon:yes gene_type:complete